MKHWLAMLPLALLATFAPARAEPTEVVVRVISADAKFVGDSMGGAQVTLRDAETGAVLAEGLTSGGTGDTARIMQANGRSPQRATPEAAAFVARIDIDRPTLVDLEVTGPVGRPASAIRVVSQRWIMPGRPVDIGDGWVVELPGLAITPDVRTLSADPATGARTLAVTAKVELMCGCPITPGGLWNAADYAVNVSLWRDGRQIGEVPLSFVRSPGEFAGEIAVPAEGAERIYIHARNGMTGNSGVVALSVPVDGPATELP